MKKPVLGLYQKNYCIFNFFTQGSKDVGFGQRMAKSDVLYITEMSL